MTQDEPVVVCGGAFLSTFPQGLDAMNAVSSLDSVPESLASQPSIAVLIPCLNEAAAIGKVIADFKAHLPTAWIFVYDNGSTDDTVKIARAAGAVVRIEPIRGKGNVMPPQRPNSSNCC
jgi:cellulose synthase/poly-beta-1,6-N-acetylglucosamine synthase-like glycosyltransferase